MGTPGTWQYDFKQVPAGLLPGEIPGLIPGTPCADFRYSYQFFVPVDFTSWTDFTQYKVKWDFQVLDKPGGNALWEQVVSFSVTVVEFVGSGYPFDNGDFIETTTYSDGTVVKRNGSEVLGSLFSTNEYGQPLPKPYWFFGIETGVWGIWYSSGGYPAMPAQPLPAGAVWHVKFHNQGMTGLESVFAPIQVATESQLALWAVARSPEHGYLFSAQCVSDGIQIQAGGDRRSFDSAATGAAAFPWAPTAAALTAPIQAKIPASGPSSPVLVRLPHHRAGWVLLWQEGGGIKLSASYENAQSWSAPMNVLSGYTPVAARVTPEGSGLLVIASGATGMVGVVLPLSYKGSALGIQDATPWPLSLTDGTALPTISGQAWIDFAGAQVVIATPGGGGLTVYSSSDGGRTWAQ